MTNLTPTGDVWIDVDEKDQIQRASQLCAANAALCELGGDSGEYVTISFWSPQAPATLLQVMAWLESGEGDMPELPTVGRVIKLDSLPRAMQLVTAYPARLKLHLPPGNLKPVIEFSSTIPRVQVARVSEWLETGEGDMPDLSAYAEAFPSVTLRVYADFAFNDTIEEARALARRLGFTGFHTLHEEHVDILTIKSTRQHLDDLLQVAHRVSYVGFWTLTPDDGGELTTGGNATELNPTAPAESPR